MPFVWDFENLKCEIVALDPADPMAQFDITVLMDTVEQSVETHRITRGEAQCLLLMLSPRHAARP